MVPDLVLTAAPLDALPPLLVAMELVALLEAEELDAVADVPLVEALFSIPEEMLVDETPSADLPELLT